MKKKLYVAHSPPFSNLLTIQLDHNDQYYNEQ